MTPAYFDAAPEGSARDSFPARGPENGLAGYFVRDNAMAFAMRNDGLSNLVFSRIGLGENSRETGTVRAPCWRIVQRHGRFDRVGSAVPNGEPFLTRF